MFESIMNFLKKLGKTEKSKETKSKQTAKDRLHLVLMQDRANVSADFLEAMKQEIIEVIKKYIEVDEKEIDVRLTNEVKEDGTTGAPSLYANIPIMNIRNEMKKEVETKVKEEELRKQEEQAENDEEKNEKVEEKAETQSEEKRQEEKPENSEETVEEKAEEEQEKEENNKENESGE